MSDVLTPSATTQELKAYYEQILVIRSIGTGREVVDQVTVDVEQRDISGQYRNFVRRPDLVEHRGRSRHRCMLAERAGYVRPLLDAGTC